MREDNADLRLTEKGYDIGVVSAERRDLVREKKARIDELTALLSSTKLAPSKSVNERLLGIGLERIKNPITLADMLRRPGIGLRDLAPLARE